MISPSLQTLKDWHPRAEQLYAVLDKTYWDGERAVMRKNEMDIWREVIAKMFPKAQPWHEAIRVLYQGWHYYGGEWP